MIYPVENRSIEIPERPIIDQTMVRRYRDNYNLGDDIGEYEVGRHWEVESALTQRLLQSTRSNRWLTFKECYTELYLELPWLNKGEETPVELLKPWLDMIPSGSRIFEIGSGKAQLLKYLAANGYDCVATEITPERGERHAEGITGLKWRLTDGINLTAFEEPSSYDVVISTQVLEHLHPDDLLEHLRSAREILKPGGRYIFDTPHVGAGPADVSKIYGFERPVCMHLKEYSFIELEELLLRAGFQSPKGVHFRLRPFKVGPHVSGWFFKYCRAWDVVTRALALSPKDERSLRSVLRLFFVPTNIWLVAQK